MKNIRSVKNLVKNKTVIKQINWSDHALAYYIKKFNLSLLQDNDKDVNYYHNEDYTKELIIVFDNVNMKNKQFLSTTY